MGDAQAWVLIITALGTMVVSIIAAIQASRSKGAAVTTNATVAANQAKLEDIHVQTNGGLERLRETNRALEGKIETLQAEIVRRADAAMPPKPE